MASEAGGRLVNDRYRLSSKLGRGGMGTVWLADDMVLGRRVALKELVLAQHGEGLSVRRERVLREARAAASIQDPGIVDIYDVFEENGRPWIVMAYIKGRSLFDLIEEDRLAERELARIGLPVLGALTAAHHAKVLHRDVKPANIVISETGRVFLVDFGIAQIGGLSSLTTHNGFTGTLEFMAPERIDGRSLGPPSDLWSLGVTFFFALEGYSPFLHESALATMKAITERPPPPATHPGRLSDAVRRLLHKDPALRMDAQELHVVLKSIVAGPSARQERHGQSRTEKVPPPAPSKPSGPTPHRPAKSGSRESPDVSRPNPSRTARPDIGRHDPPHAARPDISTPNPPHAARPDTGRLDPPQAARPGTGRLDPPRAARPDIGRLDPAEAARLVADMAAEAAARLFATMAPEAAGDVLTLAEPQVTAAILVALPGNKAASILTAVPVRTVGGLLDAMAASPRETAAVLQMLSAVKAGRAVDYMRLGDASALLRAMSPDEAARILAHTDVRTAAGIVTALAESATAVRLIEAMSVTRACAVLGYVRPTTTAGLLRASSDGLADQLLDGLSRPARTQVLRLLNGS